MINSALCWLQEWFFNSCDGEFEQEKRINIFNLKNPGWGLCISLIGTQYEKIKLEVKEIELNDLDWIHYKMKDGQFEAYCGPRNLDQAIEIFRREIVEFKTAL